MKKLYYALISISVFGLNAQTSFTVYDKYNGDAVVSNNAIFNHTTSAGQSDIKHIFEIKNTSSVTHTYSMRKYEDLMNTGAEAYFCFNGFCYIPTITSATVELAPNEIVEFDAKLDEGTPAGESHVRYVFADMVDNINDALTLTLKYTEAVTGIRETSALFSAVSGVYPNPASSGAFMDVTMAAELSGVKMTVINSLGSTVSSRRIHLNKGKNTVAVDSENLNSGIYFVSIFAGTSRITKKVTIIK